MPEIFTEAMFADGELDECGITIERFADALLCWASMNGGNMPVTQAVTVFNVDAASIRKAVAICPWLFINGPDDDVSKQYIETDGE